MPSLSRRDALRTIGLAGVASVAGCSSVDLGNGPNERPPDSLETSWSPSTDAWCFKYADLQNTARSPHEIQTPPTIKWQDRITDPPSASLISGELVAATPGQVITAGRFDSELHLRAYSAIDGKHRWNRRIQHQPGRRIPRFGGLVDGSLYMTDGGTDVIAVNVADGTIRWRRNLYDRVADAVPEKFLSPSNSAVDFSPIPVATPETVYIQSSYGLHGLEPGDGSERWRLYLGDRIDQAALEDPYGLAVTARRVWASYGGHVQALFTVRLSDGSLEIERTRLPLELPSRPVVTGDREAVLTHDIVWGTSPPETLAVGVAGEDVEWQFPGHAGEGAAAYSPLATDGDRVFVAASHEQQEQLVVFALQAATGKLEWLHRESFADRNVSVGAGGEFRLCQPAVTGGTLVVGYGTNPEQGTGHGEVVALSRAAGRVQWRSTLSIAPQDLMMTSDRLYVGGQQGTVVALADDGSG
ncbi:PQQ-binding-like beta-propeller repeat protein [Haloarcula pellucida]|uniref:Pyrrolo-quinoline quinone repeat domain-containing protein n=1 Tax=Haloarcula pellucida TaxID=1427151 RepID=A0A830GRD7_9EURY|nr:PQQ-binding-like beta-propeller repeat protein [Halomicroarcula pellucida]GGO01098.1 hypothetical protein GCM10009030_34420 [Halomicroarcula pellucida]